MGTTCLTTLGTERVQLVLEVCVQQQIPAWQLGARQAIQCTEQGPDNDRLPNIIVLHTGGMYACDGMSRSGTVCPRLADCGSLLCQAAHSLSQCSNRDML